MTAAPLPRYPPPSDLATHLLEVVERLVRETHPGAAPPVQPDSSLDRDLGLDSLARVELLARVEKDLGVRLPEEALTQVESPAELLRLVAAAAGSASPEPAPSSSTSPAPFRRQAGVAAQAGAASLIEVLEAHAARYPDREHVRFYRDATKSESLSYGQLLAQARELAGGLLAKGLGPGRAVAIMLPSGPEFFISFCGVLLAGGVPVPLYPPMRLARIEDHLRRQAGILNNCQAQVLVTMPEARLAARLLRTQVDGLERVCTVAELRPPAPPPARAARPGDLALLQYTSGSTGAPRGVALTHANLLANIRATSRVFGITPDDVCVSWLPLYHDMGLIGAWLGSLYNACPLVLMSPLTFLARPQLWLQAIHRHRGTVSAAPNFAYELCLRRIGDEDLAGLDLSSWRLALNGAETVSAATVEAFCARFAPCGFRPQALKPVYGLAECALALTLPAVGEAPRSDRVEREALSAAGEARPAAAGDGQALRYVACGRALPGHELRVVDDADRELPERRVGRVQFRGPSATAGYFRNPAETARLFHGPWLESGDLAYFAEGRLFPVGRIKDVIVRGGRNIHPQALEEAIGHLPGLRRGCVAVFGAADPASGTERVVAVAETRESDAAARGELARKINALAVELLGLPLDDIVLAPPHSVLKTSSGKIRRSATRDSYLAGALGREGSVAAQFLGLFLQAGQGELRRGRRWAGEHLYAAYSWSLLVLMAVPVWLAVAALGRPPLAWRLCHRAARLFLRLAGTRFSVEGGERLPAEPCVVVANHASYVDGLIMVAAMPRPLVFVAKRELDGQFVPGRFLRGLGAEFVARYEAARSVDDYKRLTARAGGGASLAFFPEGTFTRAPGLRPFYMGAFLAAVESGLPVIPVAIRGSRAVLRDGGWFPRRQTLSVTIGPPLRPRGDGWHAATTLRDRTRRAILRHCGEHDAQEQGDAPRPLASSTTSSRGPRVR